MTTILTKKKDTTGAPAPGDLTNSAGGAELAVNTFDKRLYTKDSGGNIVEIGTNPSTIDTTTVDTTNLEVTNIKAKDGTASATIANGTGVMTVGSSVLTTTDINGGTIDGATIGGSSAAAVSSTNLSYTGTLTGGTGVVNLGSGQFYKDASGNVGIGTSSPTARLNVQGTTTDSSAYALKVRDSSGNTLLDVRNDGYSSFVNKMILDVAGNVGIGTGTPYQAKLDVKGVGGTGSVANIGATNSNDDQLLIGSINRGSSPAFFSLPTGSAFVGAIGNGVANTLGIGTYGASPVIFATSNTERMRIDSSGNVGIGTASPTQLLTVAGNGRFTSGSGLRYLLVESGTTSSVQLATDGTANYVYGTGAFPLTFSTNASEKMRIASTGNVSIGTTETSFSKFSVVGGTGDSTIGYFACSDADLTGLAFRISPTNSTAMISSEWSSGGTELAFGIGGTERGRFTLGGDFCVGTTTSLSSLVHFSRNDAAVKLLITGDQGGGTSDSMVITYGGGAALANYRIKLGMNTYNGVMDMRNSSNADAVRITASGTSYLNGGNLLLNGGNLFIGVTSDPFGVSNGLVMSSGGHVAYMQTTAASGYAIISMRRTASDGGLTQHYNSANTYCGGIAITGSSTAYVTSSDYRLKENIAPMTGALDTISKLKPVTYKWKANGISGQGFIAHELQEFVPECVVGEKDAVNEDGSIQPQGIDTSFLVATLTAAIKEQQVLIEQLTNRLNALEGK